MTYSTWTRKKYGSKPWQYMEFSVPDGHDPDPLVDAPIPTLVIVPGGGFGVRDPNPFMDPTHAGAKPIIEYGLMYAGGADEDTYAIAILNVASQSNQAQQAFLTGQVAWVPGTEYTADDVVWFSSSPYRLRGDFYAYDQDADTWVSNDPYVAGDWVEFGTDEYICTIDVTSTTDPATDTANWLPAASVWATSTTYVVGRVVMHPAGSTGKAYKCNTEHSSTTDPTVDTGKWDRVYLGGRPGTATAVPGDNTLGLIAFDAVDSNDIAFPRVAGRGEMTNAYAAQPAADIWAANAWLRENSAEYNITTQILGFGDSAGAYNIMQSIALGDAPRVTGVDPRRVHSAHAGTSSDFDAVVLDICPGKWDLFCENNLAGQALHLGFNKSLYGNPNLGTFTPWDAYPVGLKRAVDPYRIMAETGRSVPVYFTNANPSTVYNDRLAAEVYDGDGGSFSPDAHHALHAKLYMELLTSGRLAGGTGGFARTDCVHFAGNMTSPPAKDDNKYRRHTSYPGGGVGDEGTHYDLITLADAPTWLVGNTYALDEWVEYSGAHYKSLVGSNTGNQPDISPTEWEAGTVTWYRMQRDIYLGADIFTWAALRLGL